MEASIDLVGNSNLVADLDGDGFDDILTDDFTYISDQNKGWQQIANGELGFKISRDGRYLRTWIVSKQEATCSHLVFT